LGQVAQVAQRAPTQEVKVQIVFLPPQLQQAVAHQNFPQHLHLVVLVLAELVRLLLLAQEPLGCLVKEIQVATG
jgi:hypothetical protein